MVVMVLEVVVPWILPLAFGSEFKGAVSIAQILLIGGWLASVRRVIADGIRGLGFPLVGTVGEGVALALLIPSLAILVPMAGLTGAAVAVAVAAAGGLLVVLVGTLRTELPGSAGRHQQPEEEPEGLALGDIVG